MKVYPTKAAMNYTSIVTVVVVVMIDDVKYVLSECCTRCGPLKPLRFRVRQNVTKAAFINVRTKCLGVDGIPPTVRAPNDGIEIVRITMHAVLGSILANRFSNVILELPRYRMFRCIHVSNLGLSQALGKKFPCFPIHLVRFPNVQAPNLTTRLLQNLD